ncbi:MAG: rod shape-determining protein MreD [Terriglobales bacterium]
MQRSVTSSEQVQVYRFSLPAAVGIPLLAVFLQAYLPKYVPFLLMIDLPLLVVIFFAVARRWPISGLMTGTIIGLFQDSLTNQPIGLYGIANTVIGYMASSIGMKIDVENPGSRFLMTFVFCLIHQVVYFAMGHGLVRMDLQLRWGHLLMVALLNAVVAVPVFAILDRFKQRT